MIYYLHGMDGNPYGKKYETLKNAFDDVVSIPWQIGSKTLQDCLKKWDSNVDTPITIVANSFGAYLASHIPRTPNLSFVFINPVGLDGIFPDFCMKFGELPPFNPTRGWSTTVLIGMNDTIVNPQYTCNYFKNDASVIQLDDDHKLEKLSSLQTLIQVCRETNNYPM